MRRLLLYFDGLGLLDEVDVIAPYNGQRRAIQMRISSEKRLSRIRINTVDSYQGREKDYIIFSCVRSNNHGNIGFLRDERRHNVAMTRAKRRLIVAGNSEVFLFESSWRPQVNGFRGRCVICTGQPGHRRQFQPRTVNTCLL